MRRLTAADDGATVTVEPGESVEIGLPQLGGTGYVWSVVTAEGVEVVDDHVELAGDGPSPPGEAGRRVLRVRCTSDGPGRLRLVRSRPWEDDARGDARFEVALVPRARRTGA